MITEFVTNKIVISVAVATLICQIWKVIDISVRNRGLVSRAFWATGDMPSSHSTFVTSLAISTGLVEGFSSTSFIIALALAIIVIRDAFGVRRDVDFVSRTVNEIIRKKKLGIDEILKITGHTPVQVVVGVVLGIIVPLVFHLISQI